MQITHAAWSSGTQMQALLSILTLWVTLAPLCHLKIAKAQYNNLSQEHRRVDPLVKSAVISKTNQDIWSWKTNDARSSTILQLQRYSTKDMRLPRQIDTALHKCRKLKHSQATILDLPFKAFNVSTRSLWTKPTSFQPKKKFVPCWWIGRCPSGLQSCPANNAQKAMMARICSFVDCLKRGLLWTGTALSVGVHIYKTSWRSWMATWHEVFLRKTLSRKDTRLNVSLLFWRLHVNSRQAPHMGTLGRVQRQECKAGSWTAPSVQKVS